MSETNDDPFIAAGNELNAALEALDATMQTLNDTLGRPDDIEVRKAQRNVRKQMEAARAAAASTVSMLQQMEELVDIMALFSSTLEVDLVLEDVLDAVVTLTGAERAYLLLYNNQKVLELRAARNWSQETLTEAESGLSSSVVDQALDEKKPIIVFNALQDDRFAEQASVLQQSLSSIICIPLILAGKTVGVLYADNRQKYALFSYDIVPILTAFGTQAAIAITNSQVFNQVKEDLNKATEMLRTININIDEVEVEKQVAEITSSGYFQELASAARHMRRRRKPPSTTS